MANWTDFLQNISVQGPAKKKRDDFVRAYLYWGDAYKACIDIGMVAEQAIMASKEYMQESYVLSKIRELSMLPPSENERNYFIRKSLHRLDMLAANSSSESVKAMSNRTLLEYGMRARIGTLGSAEGISEEELERILKEADDNETGSSGRAAEA